MALLPSSVVLFVSWARANTALAAIQSTRVGSRLNPVLPATRVQRIGGVPDSTEVDSPILQVECWSAEEAAADLLARTYLEQLPKFRHTGSTGRVYAYQVESGPYFAPDDPQLSNNVRHILTIRLLTSHL